MWHRPTAAAAEVKFLFSLYLSLPFYFSHDHPTLSQLIPVTVRSALKGRKNKFLRLPPSLQIPLCYLSLLSFVYLCQLRVSLQISHFHVGFNRQEVERKCEFFSWLLFFILKDCWFIQSQKKLTLFLFCGLQSKKMWCDERMCTKLSHLLNAAQQKLNIYVF